MIVSIPKWMITTSRRQGRFREERSEGSPSAKLRAYGQTKSSGTILNGFQLARRASHRDVASRHHRRPSLWGEWAQDHETLRFGR